MNAKKMAAIVRKGLKQKFPLIIKLRCEKCASTDYFHMELSLPYGNRSTNIVSDFCRPSSQTYKITAVRSVIGKCSCFPEYRVESLYNPTNGVLQPNHMLKS